MNDANSIGKKQKTSRISRDRTTIQFNDFRVEIEGENASHVVIFSNGVFTCDCEFFKSRKRCTHTMALEMILEGMLDMRVPPVTLITNEEVIEEHREDRKEIQKSQATSNDNSQNKIQVRIGTTSELVTEKTETIKEYEITDILLEFPEFSNVMLTPDILASKIAPLLVAISGIQIILD